MADMSIAISGFVSRPHVFAHTRVSLPSLFGFYCTHFQKTETPNGPTLFYSSTSVIRLGLLVIPYSSLTWMSFQTLAGC